MDDLISVIIPVYKVEQYLDRCVQSIVAQEYVNLEIILVDDGSPDLCPQKCDDWARQDARIKVIHKCNGGVSDARNVGIANSHGKYVVFVDSDDYVDMRFVACLYDQICANKAQISCVDMLMFDDVNSVHPDTEEHETEIYNAKGAMAASFNSSKFQNFVWNKMFERKLFESVSFPIGRVLEDLAVVYRLIEQCSVVSYCPVKLYYYFQRESSILHNTNKDYYKDWFFFSKEKYFYIKYKYPDMRENYQHFNLVIIESYAYLDNCDKNFARREFIKNRKFGLLENNWKNKIKFILFALNKKLFCKVWLLLKK